VVRVAGVVVKTVGVEFFCYHRDRPGSVTLRDELLEEHWSYMDRATGCSECVSVKAEALASARRRALRS
jgi:hypothetical protein